MNMKKGVFCAIFSGIILMLLWGCGGSGGSGADTGTLSIDIADAKPLLPDDITGLEIQFSKVRVHTSGGGWEDCDVITDPIDLLQLHSGKSAALVPNCLIKAGKITQLRFEIDNARIVKSGVVEAMDLDVPPSGTLKTDKNFTVDMGEGAFVALTAHFDPTRSIVVTGPPNSSYRLKPVIHLLHTHKAATICGGINPETFSDSRAIVTVIVDKDENWISDDSEELYAQIAVEKDSDDDPTNFCTYWVDPKQQYIIEVREVEDEPSPVVVSPDLLSAGQTYNVGNL
ncbi:MAG: DUF4382 domain-containing protein [Deltaproteobacteria bacterium]|nr:MAG: DUF4382 domain-containing protein [Deltaproteobacteria bacterium]